MTRALRPMLDEGDRIVGRVFLWRVISADGDIRDDMRCDDGDGGELDRYTALGMCAAGQHTVWACDFEAT